MSRAVAGGPEGRGLAIGESTVLSAETTAEIHRPTGALHHHPARTLAICAGMIAAVEAVTDRK